MEQTKLPITKEQNELVILGKLKQCETPLNPSENSIVK